MSTGSGKLELVVTSVRPGARDTNLYTLEHPEGDALPAAEAGSHIALQLPNGLVRHYSLTVPDPNPRSYRIGVKRDAKSRGGSAWIHDQLCVGQAVVIDPPRNNFPLVENSAATVLIAGGIGITPIYSMAQRLDQLGRSYVLHYSCRSRQDAIFHAELTGRANVHFHFDDEAGEILPIARLLAAAPRSAHLYCCGPGPMLAAFEQLAAKEFVSERLHVEYFTNTQAAAACADIVVCLERSGREIQVSRGQSILAALLAAGVDAAYSCEHGVCGTCEVKVLAGIPDHRDAILSPAERAANKTMMICCSGALTPRLVLDL